MTRTSGRYALGIDLGLTGARAAVADRDGKVAGTGSVTPAQAVPGLSPQDPRQWVADILEAGRLAISAAAVTRVEAIGIAALGPAPVLVDSSLRPLAQTRLLPIDPGLEQNRLQLLNDLGLDAADVPPGHPGPQLGWWRDHEAAAWERASMVLDATGFLVSALTGVPVMDTVTASDYSVPDLPFQLASPEARDATDIAGGLAEQPADKLGVPVGTPVAVGSYDSYIDFARMGTCNPHDAGILLGSTLVVGQVAETPAVLPPGSVLRSTPHLGTGYLVGGWTSAAGLTLEWCRAALGAGLGDLWDAAAGLRPGAGGLLALPYLAGERAPVWDALARGALIGLTVRTSSLEICRAMLDGVALSARDLTERLRQIVPPPEAWRVGGGGVRNAAWLKATADAIGTPLEAIDEPSGVAAAALAFSAVAAKPMRPPDTFRVVPDKFSTRRYSQLYEHYRGLYRGLASAMHALAYIDID